MLGPRSLVLAILMVAVLAGPTPRAFAGVLTSRTDTDILGLYQRLQPGMTVEQVAAAADGTRLRTSAHPVTSWLIWRASEAAPGTAVLRATFREERLARLEYELFGDAYQRLVKGRDGGAGVSQEELNQLGRRQWQVEQAAGDCQTAREAYHRLVLSAQERLTRDEQAAWVRALELRRAVESERRRATSR